MKLRYSYIAILVLAVVFAFGMSAFAGTFDSVVNGLSETGQAAGYGINTDSGEPKRDFVEGFTLYATGLAGILSALFLILMIYAGWLWMTAHGNEEQVSRAKRMIIGAVIGITFVIAARVVAELVIFTLGNILFGTPG